MDTDEPEDTLVIGSRHCDKMKTFTELDVNEIYDSKYILDFIDKASSVGMNLGQINEYLLTQDVYNPYPKKKFIYQQKPSDIPSDDPYTCS